MGMDRMYEHEQECMDLGRRVLRARTQIDEAIAARDGEKALELLDTIRGATP